MVQLFRNYQRPLMFVITVLIIIAFGLLYNGTQLDRIGADRAYRIYGQALKEADVERAARRFQLARALGLNEMIMGLVGRVYSQEQAMENFVWNSYVLTHEANLLGITPTVQEVATRMKELPGLQTNGQFDPQKYQEFIQNVLMPQGFTSLQLEDLVRDELRLRELQKLVGDTVDVTPAEFDAIYKRSHEKTHVQVIRFDLSEFTASIEPTEEQVTKYFEQNAARLQTEERRVISFVDIGPSEEEKKLTGRERIELLNKKVELADDFGQELLKEGATFAGAAEKMGLKVISVGEFSISEAPEELRAYPQAAAIAFQLTEDARDSNPLETESGGFLIVHLDKIIPARPLTLEEARPRIVEALKDEEGRNNLTTKANEVRAKIEKGLTAKASIEEAAREAGATLTSFPAFSLAEPPQTAADVYQVMEVTVGLPAGSLSKVTPTQSGAVLVYVDKRDPVDAAAMQAAQTTQLPQVRQYKRLSVFNDWLNNQRKLANPHSLRPARQAQDTEHPEGDADHNG